MKYPLSRVPALPLLAGTVVGIILRVSADAGPLWAVAAILAGLALWMLRRGWPAAMAVFVGVGIFMTNARMPEPVPPAYTGRTVTVNATVDRNYGDPELSRYYVDVDSIDGHSVSLRLLMNINHPHEYFRPGDAVRGCGVIHVIDRQTDLPDERSLYEVCRNNGVSALLWAEGENIKFMGSKPSVLQAFRHEASLAMEHAIAGIGCDVPTTDFLIATVAGDDDYIDDSTKGEFRTAGIAHILALSGLHVGVIVFLASLLLTGLHALPKGRYVAYTLLVVTVLLYAAATGFSASVGRAAVMAVVFMTSKMLGRHPSPYNSLIVSVLIWLCINPFWLFSAGLQLSATAVLAILWLNPLLCPPALSHRLRLVMSYVTVPIIAMAATSMLTAFYFHELPVWFLPVNVIAGVIVPLLVGFGAVAAVIAACGLHIEILARILDWLHMALDSTVSFFASLPYAAITDIYPQWWQMVVYLAAVAVMGWGTFRKRRLVVCSGAMMLVFMIVSFAFHIPEDDGNALYIPRRHGYTDIIIHQKQKTFIITDGVQPQATQYATRLYADYLGRRGQQGLTDAPERFECGSINRVGRFLTVGDRSFAILNTDTVSLSAPKIDYLIVGKGFTGDVLHAADRVSADTVLLAASLDRRLRKRFGRELQVAGKPYRDISETPFAIGF